MEAWLEWARGPLFWAALTFMILGLFRHVALTAWEIVRAMRKAGDKSLPTRQVVAATLKWLVPVDRLKDRWLFSLTTMVFHVSIMVVTVFLAGHVELWKSTLGFAWPALPNSLATALTVAALVAAVALVAERLASRDSRALSRFQDYAIPLVVAFPFASGFLVMHPGLNPFPFEAMLLTHVLSANLLLVLIPLTKLSHMVLLPLTQLVSEVSWHFPPDAGSKVATTLRKEGESI
jgi:nitrate reductase gamma subunit